MDPKLIESKLQEIVNKAHKDHLKRNIIKHHNRLQISCPYCQDSFKNPRNYRGSMNDSLFFRCFNCDKQTHFIQMCRDFNIDISADVRIELNDYIQKSLDSRDQYEEEYVNTNLSQLIDLDKLSIFLNSGDFNITNFEPIQQGSVVERYLLKRGIYNGSLKNIYAAKYWKNADYYEPIICLLNKSKDKVLGMQVRNLKDDKSRLFKIYNFETIHKWLNPNIETQLSEGDYFSYNRLSLFFNVLGIDFNQKITIFEGYLDSLFYPNSIGIVGVNTPTTFLETNGLDIQYFYDNDEAGWIKSEEKIKEGFDVFLWQKLIDHIIDKKKSDDPFGLENRLKKIKDLNKLAILIKDPYSNLNLQEFFSKDVLDISYIPKLAKKKKFVPFKKG